MKMKKGCMGLVLALGLCCTSAMAADKDHELELGSGEHRADKVCVGFGPQTPRNIDSKAGENKRIISLAPSYKEMNLCNIHLHKNAEHKAKAFSIYAGDGDGHGYESGYKCGIGEKLSKAELAPTSKPICKGEHGELKPGDTIEVHWVHSSCEIVPGKGLTSCLSEACSNPDLRVEAQVFTLVNDPSAPSFLDYAHFDHMENGFHQAKSIPSNTGKPVEFIGSTTGPKYNDQQCSPLQVTWSVRPQCAKVDINSVGEWCESNAFEEDHAHGVRKLVVDSKLLSKIK